jgi:hypothetical protein
MTRESVRGIKLFREENRDRFLTADAIARLNQALVNELGCWRTFFILVCCWDPSRKTRRRSRADVDFAQAHGEFAIANPRALTCFHLPEQPSYASSDEAIALARELAHASTLWLRLRLCRSNSNFL